MLEQRDQMGFGVLRTGHGDTPLDDPDYSGRHGLPG
jgi:hypothetical protein